MILATHGILASGETITYDIDAQAFITAAGITDTTQKIALNTLVTDLKGYGFYSKFKAIYPMIGGSATSHKYNLKDPRDLDAAFRLQFVNGWTHSITGAKPNGTDAYANTFLVPNNVLTTMNQHISFYSRTNLNSNAYLDMGCQDDNSPTGAGRHFYIVHNYNTTDYSIQNLDPSVVTASDVDSIGFRIASRTSSTSLKAYKNGTNVGTNTSTSTSSMSRINSYLGGFNYSVGGVFSTYYGIRECAFHSIGDGLTDTEAANLYTAVNKFNTTLGRNV
jgi:hypothetical protein